MTDRWPSTLKPVACAFGRSRQPAEQIGVASQYHYGPARRGSRALWMAECTFEIAPAVKELARVTVDKMDGMRVPMMIWDFANPYPTLDPRVRDGSDPDRYLWRGPTQLPWRWTGPLGGRHYWSRTTIDYSVITVSVAASYSAGATTITLGGFAGTALAMQRGDLIEIDEYLYVLAQEAHSVGGVTTAVLTTPLVTAITVASVVRVVEAAARMRLDQHSWSASRSWNDPTTMLTCKFIEVM